MKAEYIVKRNSEHLGYYARVEDALAKLEITRKEDVSYRAYLWCSTDMTFEEFVISTALNNVYDIEVRMGDTLYFQCIDLLAFEYYAH